MSQRPPKPRKSPKKPTVSIGIEKRRRGLDPAEDDLDDARRAAADMKERADAWARKPAARLVPCRARPKGLL